MTAAMLFSFELAQIVHNEVPWTLIGLGFAAWAVLGSAGKKSGKSKRYYAAKSEFKRCDACRVEHPRFAAYCRQCGHKF